MVVRTYKSSLTPNQTESVLRVLFSPLDYCQMASSHVIQHDGHENTGA